MKMKVLIKSSLTIIALLVCGAWAQQGSTDKAVIQEEAQDYYKKWLDEDVIYIITDEERAVFNGLSTLDEKEQFIEQFWFRRDPDPRTAENEYKSEHYRRIAYANERFSSGRPGWMSDRGRVYIIHGPPAEIEAHPAGGYYERPMSEGGGSTTAFPFEVWRYRHLEDIGDDILIEFVDPSLSGEYRIALRPEEKDALLYMPGGGPTLAEELGLATKADRPYFSAGNRDNYPLALPTSRDNPFERYEIYAKVQMAKTIKYDDLKELVKVNVGYSSLPFETHEDYFQLNENQVLVPLTLLLENKNLSFKEEQGSHVARVAVYGLVTSIANRVVAEFDDDLVTSYGSDQLEFGLQVSSVYQKVLTLDTKMRYKVDLIVKDLNSEKIGVIRKALLPPPFKSDALTSSSLILSSSIRMLDLLTDQEEMFVLGDVKVRPNLRKRFAPELPLGLYMHLYNASIDQTTLTPSLKITYRLLRDGDLVKETVDEKGESTQFFSGQRVVLVKQFSLMGLEAGKYVLRVEVEDRLSGQKVEVHDTVEVLPPNQVGLAG